MALKLGRSYGSVAANIHGHRANLETQEAIAGYLGIPREELFGGSGNRPRQAAVGCAVSSS